MEMDAVGAGLYGSSQYVVSIFADQGEQRRYALARLKQPQGELGAPPTRPFRILHSESDIHYSHPLESSSPELPEQRR
jgi:hypothetical protein